MTKANTLRLLMIASAFCLATSGVMAADQPQAAAGDGSSQKVETTAKQGLLARAFGACRRCSRHTKRVVVDRPLELAHDYVASPLYNYLPNPAQRFADGVIASLAKRGVQLAIAIPAALYLAHEAVKKTHPAFHAEWHDAAMGYGAEAQAMLGDAWDKVMAIMPATPSFNAVWLWGANPELDAALNPLFAPAEAAEHPEL